MPRIYRRIIRFQYRPGHHLPQKVLLLFLSLYYDSTKIVQLITSNSLRNRWNTAVDVATRLRLSVGPWIPFRYRPHNFLPPQSLDCLWDPPRLLFNGYRRSYLEAKRPGPEVNYSRPTFFFTLDAGLLAISQYSEGPATGHLDTGFSWFPCVYKQMLRWFQRFQIATICFSCRPPDLNLVVTNFIFCMHVK